MLPTRNRPEKLKRFIQTYLETNSKSTVLVRVDNDDPMLHNYKSIDYPDEFKLLIGKPKRCVAICNELVRSFPNAPNYTLMCDDVTPEPVGWDDMLKEAAGFNCISFGRGDYTRKDGPVPCHPCIGGDLVRHLGWFFHPDFVHDLADLMWRYFGALFPNRYVFVHQVNIKHEREERSTEPKDRVTYQRLMDSGEIKKLFQGAYENT
jgi:hypothetical protein